MSKETNKSRAARIQTALDFYKSQLLCEGGPFDTEDAIDLLADMLHWLHLRRPDGAWASSPWATELQFNEMVTTAKSHFHTEAAEK